MDSKRIFEIELELYEECKKYIEAGSVPKDDVMEACYKAFEAVQEYRKVIEKARRAATQTDQE